MDEAFEQRLVEDMAARGIRGDHLVFGQSCHSVAEAAEVAGAQPTDFVKSICLVGADGGLIVAVVKGEDRASGSRAAKLVGVPSARPATPDEMLSLTGYPCGGTPPFGYVARFLVDERVLETPVVYGGGGSERSLVRLASAELVRANGGHVGRVRR
ncbi:MAG: hypothetical protein AMXMBFR23_28700 [Chloroflexota bacterium]